MTLCEPIKAVVKNETIESGWFTKHNCLWSDGLALPACITECAQPRTPEKQGPASTLEIFGLNRRWIDGVTAATLDFTLRLGSQRWRQYFLESSIAVRPIMRAALASAQKSASRMLRPKSCGPNGKNLGRE